MSAPPDFILSGEYMAHDPQGSSSNFNTLEGEWYCLSKILATLSYFGGEKATRRRDRSSRRVITDWSGCLVTSPATPSPHYQPLLLCHGTPFSSSPVSLSLFPTPNTPYLARMFTSPAAASRLTELFNWSIHFCCLLPFHASNSERLTDRRWRNWHNPN